MTKHRVPRIPILEAISIGKPKVSGRNKPIAINCSALGSTRLAEYIVKFYGDIAYQEHSLARELIGSLLALYFGLNTPEPAIVNIPSNFYKLELNPEASRKIELSPGYNFGSKTIETAVFTPLPSLTEKTVPEATLIFAFDALLLNLDRRAEKPNLFVNDKGYILYDHELAFPYSRPQDFIGGIPKPWELSGSNLQTLKNHFFYKGLREHDLDFEPFVERLANLHDDLLEEIKSRVPVSWQSEHLNNIMTYIQEARNNANLMKKGLQEVLG